MNNQAQPELVIEAGRTEGQYWKDIWHYRELFYFLAWRDILVRYKQTVIGIAWSLIRPLLTIFNQSHGRSHRRFPLGAPRTEYPIVLARISPVDRPDTPYISVRPQILP